MKKGIKKVARTIALILLLFATGQAWATAPTPTVVWRNNLGESYTVGGVQYAIAYNNGSLGSDGNITTANGYNLGATIDLSAISGLKNVSVLVKYSGLSLAASRQYGIAFAAIKDSSNYEAGAYVKEGSATDLYSWAQPLNANEYTPSAFSPTREVLTDSGYMLFSYSAATGMRAYMGATIAGLTGGESTYSHEDVNVISLSIGGPAQKRAMDSSGMVIEEVALFVDQYLSNTDVADFEFPTVTTASETELTMTQLNTKTAALGANEVLYFTSENPVVTRDVDASAATQTFLKSANWCGTVWLKDWVKENIDFTGLYNSNSTIRLTSVVAWFSSGNKKYDTTIELVDGSGTNPNAFRISDAYSATVYIKKLKGNGTLLAEKRSGGGTPSFYLQIGDVSGFSGAITVNDKCVVLGNTNPSSFSDGTIFVPSGTTVSPQATLTAKNGFTINGTLNVTSSGGAILVTSASEALPAVKGSGTVTYTGVLPNYGTGWWSSDDWTGTVWLKDYTVTDFQPNLYGNLSSTLKLSGVSGSFAETHTCNVPVELSNSGYSYGLNVTGGSPRDAEHPDRIIQFAKLKGDGAFWTAAGSSVGTILFQVLDWSQYTGSLAFPKQIIVLGDSVPTVATENTAGTIYICSGKEATINSSVNWRADGHVVVNGTLKVNSMSRFSSYTSNVQVNAGGVLELTSAGSVSETGTSTWDILTGNGTLKYNGTGYRTMPYYKSGNTVKYPATTLTLENAQAGGGLVIHTSGVTIGSLSGSEHLRSDWSGATYASPTHTLIIKQGKDTTWSGIFNESEDRLASVTVDPCGETVGTLTIAGDQIAQNASVSDSDWKKRHTEALIVNGSVNLTGKWVGNTTVNGQFGGIGTISGDLSFASDSTFKVWATDADGLIATGALTLPESGKVTVDVSPLTIGAAESTTLLTVSSGVNLNKLELSGAESHMLAASGSTTLNLVPIAATITRGDGSPVENFASANAALERLSALKVAGSDLDAYATIIIGSTTYTAEQLAAYDIVYNSSDGRYVIAEAKIDTTLYPTIEAAIADADESDTVELVRNISRNEVAVNTDIAFSEGDYNFTGTFTGNGTLIMTAMPNAISTASLWAEGWKGTLWLKNVTLPVKTTGANTGKPDVNIARFGNANSTLRLTGCSGGFNTDYTYNESNHKFLGTVDLMDDGDTKAFTVTSAWPAYGKTVFAKLTGTGTFTGNGTGHCYQFCDASKFEGTINLPNSGKLRVVIGSNSVDANTGVPDRQIIIQSGATATIKSGKTWAAPGACWVSGRLNIESLGVLSATIKGGGEVSYGAIPASVPTFENWTGMVELPVFGAAGIKLADYGTSSSKIKINGITDGYLHLSDQDVLSEVVLDGHVNITQTYQYDYRYAHISGTGSFSVATGTGDVHDPSSLTITKLNVTAGSVGMAVTNNTGTTLTITELALPEGVSVAAGTKLLTIGGSGSITVGSVTVGGESRTYPLEYRANDGVYVYAATRTSGETVTTYYASAQAAFNAIADLADVVTVYVEGESITMSTMWNGMSAKIATANGVTVAVQGPSGEYAVTPSAGDGYTVYSLGVAETTYVWIGASDNRWNRPSNWQVGTSDGYTASRSPGSTDTVVLGDGANILLSSVVSVSGISVGGDVALSGAGAVTITSSTPILLGADDTITVTNMTLLPRPTTNVARSRVIAKESSVVVLDKEVLKTVYSVELIPGTIFSVY